jgi:hypothetical protein
MDRRQLAKQLLESPLLDEIFAQVRADTIERWEAAETVEAREECHRVLQVGTQFAETLNVRIRELAGDGARESDD